MRFMVTVIRVGRKTVVHSVSQKHRVIESQTDLTLTAARARDAIQGVQIRLDSFAKWNSQKLFPLQELIDRQSQL